MELLLLLRWKDCPVISEGYRVRELLLGLTLRAFVTRRPETVCSELFAGGVDR